MKKNIIKHLIILTFFCALIAPQSASAGIFDDVGDFVVGIFPTPDSPQPASTTNNNEEQAGCTFTGEGEEKCKLENPIGPGPEGTTEATDLIRIVINAALGLIGAFTLLMLVWGGFQWFTSAGNPEKVSAGTQTMVWAVIGVVIVLSSYLLLSTFLQFLVSGN